MGIATLPVQHESKARFRLLGPKAKVVHQGVLPCHLGRFLQLKNVKTPKQHGKTPSWTIWILGW
jgi:hypothetical protein